MSRLHSTGWRSDLLDGKFPPFMAKITPAPESLEMVAARLKELRLAMGFDQAEICRKTGIGPSAWNNAETGDNRIGLENAIKLRRTFLIGTDYTYFGDVRALPRDIADQIDAYRASQRASKRA